MTAPGTLAVATEAGALPAGPGERFEGYGVMGQPFRSGHALALRRFAQTSIGPGYTSVWHATPDGRWTIWSDVEPLLGCARYFGPALVAAEECAITLDWPDPHTLRVAIDGVLDWRTSITATASTRLMTGCAAHLPDRLWRSRSVLAGMGRMAGPMLRAGTIRLQGRVPSDQWFEVNPTHVWATTSVEATVLDEPLGPPGRGDQQHWLGGFALPDRGLFAVGRAAFETFDADRHSHTLPAPV